MRGLTLATVVLLATGAAAGALADEARPGKWTPELTLSLKRVGVVQVSPDGRFAAFTVRTPVMEEGKSEYRTHVHLANVEDKRTWQLTQGDQSCDEPQWSPDGRRIAFISSRSGKANLWLISVDGGEARQLTDLSTDVSSFLWSPDGKSIACTALDPSTDEEEKAKRDKADVRVVDDRPKKQRLYLATIDDTTSAPAVPRRVTDAELNVALDPGRAGKAGFDWTPDGRTLVVCRVRTPSPDDWPTASISCVDVASGRVTPLLDSPAAEMSPRVSPDGKSLAFIASDDPPTWAGRRTIHVVPLAGGDRRALAETADNFGRYSELIGWTADGHRLVYAELHRTAWRLMAMPLDGSPSEIGGGEGGDGMSLSGAALNASRTAVGFAWERLSSPSEAAVARLDRFEPKVVSQVNDEASLPPMPRTKVIRWKSTDGLEIEGLLTYPADFREGERRPLLTIVHGGPSGVFTRTCDANPGTYPVAAFASQGYAVLRANVRGSSGYGAKFRYANYGDWGGGDYHDLMAGIDKVVEMGVADENRLGIMGWSYGGFMTSWTVTQTKRFRAASVGAGVTNLLSFTGTADIPGFLPDYFGGEFWENFKTYRAHSPVLQAKGVATPTLIQHGDKDERVPLSQGKEFYNALKRQGCETQLVIYPRTPHAIEEPRLLLDCMRRNLDWFDRHLKHAN